MKLQVPLQSKPYTHDVWHSALPTHHLCLTLCMGALLASPEDGLLISQNPSVCGGWSGDFGPNDIFFTSSLF
jgi:hypothetical protein